MRNGLTENVLHLWNNMPRYDFLNTETGEIKEYTMSWKDLDEFKKNNPHLLQQINTPQIVGGTGDRVKTDAGFKEVLSKVGSKFPHSPLDKKMNGVSIKDQKTREIVEKHVDIQNKKK